MVVSLIPASKEWIQGSKYWISSFSGNWICNLVPGHLVARKLDEKMGCGKALSERIDCKNQI